MTMLSSCWNLLVPLLQTLWAFVYVLYLWKGAGEREKEKSFVLYVVFITHIAPLLFFPSNLTFLLYTRLRLTGVSRIYASTIYNVMWCGIIAKFLLLLLFYKRAGGLIKIHVGVRTKCIPMSFFTHNFQQTTCNWDSMAKAKPLFIGEQLCIFFLTQILSFLLLALLYRF